MYLVDENLNTFTYIFCQFFYFWSVNCLLNSKHEHWVLDYFKPCWEYHDFNGRFWMFRSIIYQWNTNLTRNSTIHCRCILDIYMIIFSLWTWIEFCSDVIRTFLVSLKDETLFLSEGRKSPVYIQFYWNIKWSRRILIMNFLFIKINYVWKKRVSLLKNKSNRGC